MFGSALLQPACSVCVSPSAFVVVVAPVNIYGFFVCMLFVIVEVAYSVGPVI